MDQGIMFDERIRIDDCSDDIIKVPVVIDTRNPRGVRRAGVGEGYQGNQDDEET